MAVIVVAAREIHIKIVYYGPGLSGKTTNLAWIFEHLPMDWSDLRFLLRGTATAMRNHDALDETDFRRVEALSRDGAEWARERLAVVLPGALPGFKSRDALVCRMIYGEAPHEGEAPA